MDITSIIVGLWVGSVYFFWVAIGFAIALVILSTYMMVTDWNGSMDMFEQLFSDAKRRFKK